jgi:hypothetical protein
MSKIPVKPTSNSSKGEEPGNRRYFLIRLSEWCKIG